MRADLHVHSRYSDGSDCAEAVIKKARDNGVAQLSFVEHDSVEGFLELTRLGEKYGIELVPGIEISAYDFKRDRKVHVLGYNFHSNAVHMKSICEPLLKRRQEHSLEQIEKLQAAGYALDLAAIIELAKPSKTIYKQHIMKSLTDAAYTSPEYKRLYKSLFKGDGVASGDVRYIDAFDAVRAIKADGGVAVVAHPGQLDSYDMIPELVEAGLSGIERNHLDHTVEDHHRVEALAEKYNLVMTGGSDYHGSFGAAVNVGDILSPTQLKGVNNVKSLC